MIKSALAISLIAASGFVHAAGTAQASPAKQQLVNRVLELWKVEMVGEAMLLDPVNEAVVQARAVIQGRVQPEKQEAAMREVANDAKKFLDDNRPLVRTSAQKHASTTVAPLLMESFTEDELRQLVAILESPVKAKFEKLVPDMSKALGEKLAADAGATINPQLGALRERIGVRLRTAILP